MTIQLNSFRRFFMWFLAITTALIFAGCTQAIKFNNVDITGSKAFGKDFSLIDHHGKKRQLSDFKGQVVVMFYGYTQCPDVCPTTMTEMQGVMDLLGKDALTRCGINKMSDIYKSGAVMHFCFHPDLFVFPTKRCSHLVAFLLCLFLF